MTYYIRGNQSMLHKPLNGDDVNTLRYHIDLMIESYLNQKNIEKYPYDRGYVNGTIALARKIKMLLEDKSIE